MSKFMSMTLKQSINCPFRQITNKLCRLVIWHPTVSLFSIFGPFAISIGNIAIISQMGKHKNCMCSCLFQFFALIDYDVLIVQKFILGKQSVFKCVCCNRSKNSTQPNHSDSYPALKFIHLRKLLLRKELRLASL